MRKVELVPTRNCEAGYGPVFDSIAKMYMAYVALTITIG